VRPYEQLIAISISTVLVMAGQGVISPVLPLYADSFGVSTAMVGATVTAFGLARLFTNIPAGILADSRGRRILLVFGPLVTAAGMFGSGLSTTIWTLLAFRFVAGLGSGLYMTGAQIYLLDIALPHQRGRFLATNQGALLVGVGFGPAIGGLLAGAYGLSTPFFVVAAGALLTSFYGYVRLPETLTARDPSQASGGGDSAPSRWALLRSSDFLAVGLVSVGVFSIRAGVRQTLVPLQLNQVFEVEVAELGVLFTALGLIGMVLIWPAGWVVDRFGHKVVIVPTALMISVGIGIVAFADTLPVFIAGLTISAVGSGITGPAPAAYVAELVADDQRGAAMGMYRTFGDIGVVVSPVLSGLLADAVSIPFAIGVNAAFMGLAGLGFWLVASPTGAAQPAPSRT
jgi:DHA1 family multidrug resistance protein-like MFS transporter